MKEETEELAEKFKERIELHAKLVDEFEKYNRNVSRFVKQCNYQSNPYSQRYIFRNSYTSRILEIIGNVKKQKADIDRILNDTRDLQKEINTISGQLDRQFTVTDDLLFKVNILSCNVNSNEPQFLCYISDSKTR